MLIGQTRPRLTAGTTKPEGLTWNTDAFGTLDALFAAELTGDVNVNLMGNISTANQVNVSYTKDVKYHFKTNVEGGATMSMSYDNWNCLPHFSIAEDVTLNVTYLQMVGGDAEISGTINTHYLYMYGTGEGVTVESTGKIVVEGEDKTIQVKGGTVFTVYGEVSTSTLNVWTQDSNASTMIISGCERFRYRQSHSRLGWRQRHRRPEDYSERRCDIDCYQYPS